MMTAVLKDKDGLRFIPVEHAYYVDTIVFQGGREYYVLEDTQGHEVARFGTDECLGVFEGKHFSLDVKLEKKED